MWTILLLTFSNIFMTFAWYGHLKFFKGDTHSMWAIILVSWGIAFFEYCLMVPANRLGKANGLATADLKVMQEIITLVVFAFFSVLVLKERLQWNHLAAFVCIVAAGFFVFSPSFRRTEASPLEHPRATGYSGDQTAKES